MAILSAPRTPLTKRLDRSRGQFFQWYFVEEWSIPRVKKEMDKLSLALQGITGDDFQASIQEWKSRQRQWNKRWKIKNADRGSQLAVPMDIVHLPVWRRGGQDVGGWRETTRMLGYRPHKMDIGHDIESFCDQGSLDPGTHLQTGYTTFYEDTCNPPSVSQTISTPSPPSCNSQSSFSSFGFDEIDTKVGESWTTRSPEILSFMQQYLEDPHIRSGAVAATATTNMYDVQYLYDNSCTTCHGICQSSWGAQAASQIRYHDHPCGYFHYPGDLP